MKYVINKIIEKEKGEIYIDKFKEIPKLIKERDIVKCYKAPKYKGKIYEYLVKGNKEE